MQLFEMQFSFIVLCFTTHFLNTLALSANSSHASSTGSCKLRSEWRKSLNPSYFDPSPDCWGLNKILATAQQSFRQNRTFNFCAADPDVVFKYINSSLSALKPRKRPLPCEVHQWYYGNYGGKMRKSFCQNATDINRLATSRDPSPAHTEPYITVFYGPRTQCNQKFKSDLNSIGDPDVAGIGVLISQIIGMVLLLFFHLAALWPTRFPFALHLLKTIRQFYVTAIVLGFSVTVAALVTFWRRRSASKSLHDNFGHVDFYVNSMLVLMPPLSAMPAIVLILMSSIREKKDGEYMTLWDEKGKTTKLRVAQVAVTILYTCCIVVMWIIWSVGVRGQQNPTEIVFGTRLNVRVSSFLYEHASTYVLVVCILMSALPAAGSAAFAALSVWYGMRRIDPDPRRPTLFFLRDRCRDICFLFGTLQLVMIWYIRGQAVYQANGTTSETGWGFGQILIIFTWIPLLLSILSEIFSDTSTIPWLRKVLHLPQR